jgi:hypothetical protein
VGLDLKKLPVQFPAGLGPDHVVGNELQFIEGGERARQLCEAVIT